MSQPLTVPTETDYRAVLGIAIVVLVGFIFGVVLYSGGTIQDAITATSAFSGLLYLVYNWYFKSKE